MAQTVLAVAALHLVIGLLAYAVPLSGREVTFIVPLSVSTEVGLGLTFMGAAATALVAAAVALVLDRRMGVVAAGLAGASFGAELVKSLIGRWHTDAKKVRSHRADRETRRGG